MSDPKCEAWKTHRAFCPQCGNGLALRGWSEKTPPRPWSKPEMAQLFCESCGYAEEPRLHSEVPDGKWPHPA